MLRIEDATPSLTDPYHDPAALIDAAFERFVYDAPRGDGLEPVLLDFTRPGDGSPESGSHAWSLARRYLTGPLVDQVLAQENLTRAWDDPDRVQWFLADQQGTVRDVLDRTGQHRLHVAFDAFGGASELRWTVAAGVAGSGAVFEQVVTAAAGFDLTAQLAAVGRHWFQGRELDAWTNFYYVRARWLDPLTGTWLSEDPIRHLDDWNLARFVKNDPVNATDPTGLAELANHWSAVEVSSYPADYNIQHRGGTSAQIGTAIALAEALYAVQQRREALQAERAWAQRYGLGPNISGWCHFVCTLETQSDHLKRLDQELAQLGEWDREIRDAFAAAGLDGIPFRAGGVGYPHEGVEEGTGIDHWAKGLGPLRGRSSAHPIHSTGDEMILVDLVTMGVSGLVRRGSKALLQKGLAATANDGAARMAASVAKGRAGELAAGTIGPKIGVRGPISGKMRFPDHLTNVLIESKNVARQGWTAQLKDYAAIAKERGIPFILRVRESTILSKPLQAARERGDVIIEYLPGL